MIDLTTDEMVSLYGDADGDVPHRWKPDWSKFVVVPSVDHGEDGHWCLAPKVFWDNNGCIPDWHSGLDLPEFGEVQEHSFEYEGDGDPVSALREIGVSVDTEPSWYFDR